MIRVVLALVGSVAVLAGTWKVIGIVQTTPEHGIVLVAALCVMGGLGALVAAFIEQQPEEPHV